MSSVFNLITAMAVLALLVAERRDSQVGRALIKPVASAGFLASALAHGAAGSGYGRTVLVALALSWLGDMLLIPRSKRIFRAGILAFLLGHVAFVAAFLGRGVDPGVVGGTLVLALVAAVLVGRWLLPRVPPQLKPAVMGYIVVISIMVPSALGTGHRMIALGAVAFYLSDLSVARERFVAPGFINRLWGLPLYYGAQLVLASTP